MDTQKEHENLPMQPAEEAQRGSHGDKQAQHSPAPVAEHNATYTWTGAWGSLYIVSCPCGFYVKFVDSLSQAVAIRDRHNAKGAR